VGALIAIVAIIGNVEKYAVILFIPYFIELILKARGNLIKESFAAVQNDGSLEKRYGQWYGIEHIALDLMKKMKGKATEQSVIYSIFTFQCFFAVIAVILFFLN